MENIACNSKDDRNTELNANVIVEDTKINQQNAELKEQNSNLIEENVQLKEQIAKLMEQLEMKKQKGPAIQTANTSYSHDDLLSKMDEKRGKIASKRFVPNWLIEVIAWIDRIEMANSSLSTSSWTFKQLCWPKLHLDVKPNKMPKLNFFRGRCTLGKVQAMLRIQNSNHVIPIASVPPPEYINGTNEIILEYMDKEILNFLQNIRNFFQSCTFICVKPINVDEKVKRRIEMTIHSLLKYFENQKLFGIFFESKSTFIGFHELFPGIIDKSIQALLFGSQISNLEIDLLVKWLCKHRNNGKQKMADLYYFNFANKTTIINQIREEFVQSNLPSNFFIFLGNYNNSNGNAVAEFTMENAATNEILTLYGDGDTIIPPYFLLARYPKGEEHWKEEGQKKIKQFTNFSALKIYLK